MNGLSYCIIIFSLIYQTLLLQMHRIIVYGVEMNIS